jgi:hypothetical protein
MLSQNEKRIVRSFMAVRKVIATPAPAPKKAPVARRAPVKKAKEPYVLQITILHEPQEDGNDVIFKHRGEYPMDLGNPDDLEQHIADFFGDGSEDEEEFDDEFEE